MPPTMLLDSLQGIRRRVRVLGVIYGAGIVVAAAVVLVLAAVLIDWALKLPLMPRLVVNLGCLGALGYAMHRWVVRPLLARLTLNDLAGRIEHVFPQFDDRLRSTVNFVDSDGRRGDIPGSEVMKERTVSEAMRLAQQVDLRKAVVLKPVWYSIAGALAAVGLFVTVLMLVDPNIRRIATNRLFAGGQPWPKKVEIQMLDGIPQRVPVGQQVPIRLKLKKGTAKQAIVRYRYDNGPWHQEVVKPDAEGVYSTSLDARLDGEKTEGKIQVQVEAGDDEQNLNAITVVPRLDVRGVIAKVRPPAYAQLPAVPVNIAERPVVTAVGSEIDLEIAFNKGLDSSKGVTLQTGASKTDPATKAMAGVTWTFPAADKAVGRLIAHEVSKPGVPIRFTIHATDSDGFDNVGSQEYQVIVHEDGMPTVQIEEPRRSEERTPNASFPLRAMMEDDYGIGAVKLMVEGKSPSLAGKNWDIDLVANGQPVPNTATSWGPAESTTERKRFRMEYQWDLERLANANLKPGDVIEFFVRVKDNYRLPDEKGGIKEHAFVDSSRLRITIISHEQWEAAVEHVLANTKTGIDSIRKGVDVTKAEAQNQAQETQAKGKLDDAQKTTIGRLANQQSTSTAHAKQEAQKLEALVQKMKENKTPETPGGMKETAKKVAEMLDQAAEEAMKNATADLNQAKDTKSDPKSSASQQKADAAKAAQALSQAAQNQQKASEQLEAASKQLDKYGGLKDAIAKIEKLKADQAKLAQEYKEAMKNALGKKPEELTEQEKKDLARLAQQQEDLAPETAKALDQMEQKGQKMEKVDPASSKAMQEAAQTGKAQGIPQKQSNSKSKPQKGQQPPPGEPKGAAQEMEQNQQANAQQKHKEIDIGLEMILAKLREAEKRKLEEIQKELAEMQKLIEELIIRQAGHNIDNLIIQDLKKVTELTQEVRDQLFALAMREQAKLAEMKPELTVLTPSQEQSERNARDYAKRAEGLSDPTPASKLTAAASKMEQAIVFLRKAELAGAYPEQELALKNLLDAKAAVDELKKKADDERNQLEEESIKRAYVRILEAQKKLDKDTADADGTPRDAEGNLPFLVARRVGQLPAEQAKLADDTTKVGEKLAAIKSIVYVYANKDIVSSMNEVKDDLAKPETGKVTQAEQLRIEEQLQAMIDNLAQKPPEPKRFAEKNPGGKGGQGQPGTKMPTEVELRLLRDLQLAVNKSTKTIEGEVEKAGGKKDAPKLLKLGNRQGDLRNQLDLLLQQASEGAIKLGPEPANDVKLPEEAGKVDVDNQEFVEKLLGEDPGAEDVQQKVKLMGDRMARSRGRLIDTDPGKITQEIQKRIVLSLNDMIKLAQQQQQQASSKPGSGKPGDKPGPPKPGEGNQPGQANGQGKTPGKQSGGGQSPAADSSLSGNLSDTDLSKEILERAEEWGRITERDRDAVLEGSSEKALGDYDQLIKDYYRDVAKKASERK